MHETKICKRCGDDKILDDFNEHSTCSDGKTNTCKSCMTEVRAERRKKKKAEKDLWNQFLPI